MLAENNQNKAKLADPSRLQLQCKSPKTRESQGRTSIRKERKVSEKAGKQNS